MGGEPLAQAKRVTCSLIDGLSRSRHPGAHRVLEPTATVCPSSRSTADRQQGRKKCDGSGSSRCGRAGGTEMVSGILAALAGVRAEAQRQVVVITDGLIGFERDVVSAILEQLPPGSRLHTVGVGSAVNRSLTGPAARAGRGVEVVIGLGEDPERASRRLLERTEQPIVVDLDHRGRGPGRAGAAATAGSVRGESRADLGQARIRPGVTCEVRGRTASGTVGGARRRPDAGWASATPA